MRKIIFISLAVVMVLLSSCKGSRSLEKGAQATSFEHLIKLIQKAAPSFTTMNASNTSITVNFDGQQMNTSASIRMITDSVMILTVSPFMGIELYSVELYPNRWILYDKMNRNYYTDNYDYLFYKFGIRVDFNALQSLFSARLFAIGQDKINAKKCEYTPLEFGKNQIECESERITQTIQTADNHTIEKVTLEDRNKTFNLTTTYSDYMVTKGVNFPRNIRIEASTMNGMMPATANIKIQKIAFDTELKLSVSNPERYTRKTLDQLIK